MSAGVASRAVIAPESPYQASVGELLRRSDAYSRSLYPPAASYLIDADQLARPNVRFLVARIDGNAVGCGAVVLGADGEGELKRIFVADEARGQRLGARLVEALEALARAEDVRLLRLETGPYSLPALALYRRLGYRECAAFGDYPDDPLSVFMEKNLV
ncbi:putative acetyltransferase [Stella humosa]|uniref:Putative acetyltransferase n=1 Tax=Stella humosa TaxID=94 RepID=A0A3N1MKG2_9PROT|nr:GNAT family N-acetyltransferase [Stella humosa]ROQ01466.1 putative acetyltransferase [Stella humosa]BBK31844.1 N-acetyltransferase [Stella humosa]